MSKELHQLQREWYQRLALSGFVDIEKKGQLKVCESLKWTASSNRRSPEAMAEKAEFYRMANDFLVEWGGVFMSDTEELIWSLYCDGHGCRSIAALLSSRGIQTNKDYVHWAIKDLKQTMLVVMNVG